MMESHTTLLSHLEKCQVQYNAVEKGLFRKGIDTSAIATGLVALYDGLTINNLFGVNEAYNKKAWTETVIAIISGIS